MIPSLLSSTVVNTEQKTPVVSKLLLIGAGLIGGSLTLSLKRNQWVDHVIGVGRRPETMQDALDLGIVDAVVAMGGAPWQEAIEQVDMIVLAMPVGQTAQVLKQIKPFLRPNVILTDVGSTKVSVFKDVQSVLGDQIGQFVLAHPIAGREVNGPQAALEDLYINKNVIICPLPENQPAQIELVSSMWQTCGARVSHMTIAEHDEIFAAVSHLPHVLAYGLVNHVECSTLAQEKFMMAGAGFRDFTRIAASSPEMWRDICLNNKTSLLHEIEKYMEYTSYLQQLIQNDNSEQLLEEFRRASERRLSWKKEGDDE